MDNNLNIFYTWRVKKWSKEIIDMIINTINVNNNYNINRVKNYNLANIIISHICDRNYLHNSNAIKIIINSESSKRQYLGIYDIYITSTLFVKQKNYIYLPFLYQSLLERKKRGKIHNNNNKNFCIYLYSATHKHRVKYFNLLNNYKKVDAPGKCCHNIELNTDRDSINYLNEAVQLYSKYKFVISIENTFETGYFTEKIINPILAGSIPIYSGDSYVFNYINKERVIYINDFSCEKDLMNYVEKIDNDIELYNSIISKPTFLKNKSLDDIIMKFTLDFKNIINQLTH